MSGDGEPCSVAWDGLGEQGSKWLCSLPCCGFRGSTHTSKRIKQYTCKMCGVLNINYTKVKLLNQQQQRGPKSPGSIVRHSPFQAWNGRLASVLPDGPAMRTPGWQPGAHFPRGTTDPKHFQTSQHWGEEGSGEEGRSGRSTAMQLQGRTKPEQRQENIGLH